MSRLGSCPPLAPAAFGFAQRRHLHASERTSPGRRGAIPRYRLLARPARRAEGGREGRGGGRGPGHAASPAGAPPAASPAVTRRVPPSEPRGGKGAVGADNWGAPRAPAAPARAPALTQARLPRRVLHQLLQHQRERTRQAPPLLLRGGPRAPPGCSGLWSSRRRRLLVRGAAGHTPRGRAGCQRSPAARGCGGSPEPGGGGSSGGEARSERRRRGRLTPGACFSIHELRDPALARPLRAPGLARAPRGGWPRPDRPRLPRPALPAAGAGTRPPPVRARAEAGPQLSSLAFVAPPPPAPPAGAASPSGGRRRRGEAARAWVAEAARLLRLRAPGCSRGPAVPEGAAVARTPVRAVPAARRLRTPSPPALSRHQRCSPPLHILI